MKKTLAIAIVCILCFSMFSIFTPNANVQALSTDTTIFEDNFDSYGVGGFPSAGGWELIYNGMGNQYQIVTDAVSYSPTKSLQLWGQNGWSANAQKTFSSSSEEIGYEAYLRAESNTGSADNVASIGFWNLGAAPWGKRFAVVYFDETGIVYTAPIHLGPVWVSLGSYEANRWYKFRVVIDRAAGSYDVWIDDSLAAQDIAIPDTYEIEALMLASGHAGVRAYFDDVRVFEMQSSASPGLVGYWNFDEGSGSVAFDSSGNNYDGAVNGAEWINGVSNGALYFDGSDYVAVPDNPSLSGFTQLTLEAWIKSDRFDSYLKGIVNKGNGGGYFGDEYGLQLNYDKVRLILSAGSPTGWIVVADTDPIISLNQWYHVAGVWDSTNYYIYVNGQLAKSGQTIVSGASIHDTSNSLNIGGIAAGSWLFNGAIDEVKIYNYARTAQDILNDYNSVLVSLPWRDDFTYANNQEMKDAGWQFDNEVMVSVGGGILTVDNDGSLGGGANYRNHFVGGIYDFKAEVKGRWSGRSYGAPHIKLYTERHEYLWAGDAYYGQYVLNRDGIVVLRFSGYAPQLNVWQVFSIEKTGNILRLYQDGILKSTYTEPDSTPDALTGVATTSHWQGTLQYDYISVAQTPRRFDPSRDGFNFINHDYFFVSEWCKDNTEDFLENLQTFIETNYPDIYQRIPMLQNDLSKKAFLSTISSFVAALHEWGHCFGMSKAAKEFFIGEHELPSGVAEVYDLQAPRYHETYAPNLQKIIDDDQNSLGDPYLLARLFFLRIGFTSLEEDYEIIRSLVSVGIPAIVSLRQKDNALGFHAVLAYDIDDFQKRIYIYDPNAPYPANTDSYLQFHETGGSLSMDEYEPEYEFNGQVFQMTFDRMTFGEKPSVLDEAYNYILEFLNRVLSFHVLCPVDL